MNDAELTQALRHIGVDRHTLRALPLLPLVQVAWADGVVQSAERGLILEVAERYGLNGAERALLDRWLSDQREEADFLLARQVLLVLWSRDRDRGQAPESLDGVVRMCMCVARVAGGLFGLAFTMDPRERELIGEISRTLQLGPKLTPAARKALPAAPWDGPASPGDETVLRPRRLAAPVDEPLPLSAFPSLPSTPVGEEPPPEEAAPAPEPEPTPDPPSDPQAARWFLDETRPLDRQANGGWGIGGETLLPPEHDDEEAASSSTVPLATLRRMIDEQEATEIDLPMLPQDYVFDDD